MANDNHQSDNTAQNTPNGRKPRDLTRNIGLDVLPAGVRTNSSAVVILHGTQAEREAESDNLANHYKNFFKNDFQAFADYHYSIEVTVPALIESLKRNNDTETLAKLEAQSKTTRLALNLDYAYDTIGNGKEMLCVRPNDILTRADFIQVKAILEYLGAKYISKKAVFAFSHGPRGNEDYDANFPAQGSKIDPTHYATCQIIRAINDAALRIDGGAKLNDKEFFPTSAEVANFMVDNLFDYGGGELAFSVSGENGKPFRILEPGAGDGALIDAIFRKLETIENLNPRIEVVAIEMDSFRAAMLQRKYENATVKGIPVNVQVIDGDFLKTSLSDLGGSFSMALMNPPFQHVPEFFRHASDLLDKDGTMASIAPSLTSKIKMGGKDGDFARDILYEASGHAVYHDTLPANAFMTHETKRASVSKTTIDTSLIVSPSSAYMAARQERLEVPNFCLFENNSVVHKIASDIIHKEQARNNNTLLNGESVLSVAKAIGTALQGKIKTLAADELFVPTYFTPEYIGVMAGGDILSASVNAEGVAKIIELTNPLNIYTKKTEMSPTAINARLATLGADTGKTPAAIKADSASMEASMEAHILTTLQSAQPPQSAKNAAPQPAQENTDTPAPYQHQPSLF